MLFLVLLVGLPVIALIAIVAPLSSRSPRPKAVASTADETQASRYTVPRSAPFAAGLLGATLVAAGTWGIQYISAEEASHCGRQHMSGSASATCIMLGAFAIAVACFLGAARFRGKRLAGVAMVACGVLALPLGAGYLMTMNLGAAFMCG